MACATEDMQKGATQMLLQPIDGKKRKLTLEISILDSSNSGIFTAAI